MEPENTFVREAREAGFEVFPYHGRWYWEGPAVRGSSVDDLIEVARGTTVELQWDSPIIYPRQADKEWYDWAQANSVTDTHDELDEGVD